MFTLGRYIAEGWIYHAGVQAFQLSVSVAATHAKASSPAALTLTSGAPAAHQQRLKMKKVSTHLP